MLRERNSKAQMKLKNFKFQTLENTIIQGSVLILVITLLLLLIYGLVKLF